MAANNSSFSIFLFIYYAPPIYFSSCIILYLVVYQDRSKGITPYNNRYDRLTSWGIYIASLLKCAIAKQASQKMSENVQSNVANLVLSCF